MAAAQAVEEQLLQAAGVVEQYVDKEITRLEEMDHGEIETLRQNRLKELKRMEGRKEEWKNIGHGEYSELADQKEFFEEQKKSERFVCHFYRDATHCCKIADMHLGKLAKKHMETRFVKIEAEKSMFICEKLKVKVLPTIACFRDSMMIAKLEGFDEFGGVEDFPTEMMEWKLGTGQLDMLNYEGDKPDLKKKGSTKKTTQSIFGYNKPKKSIRGGDDSDDEDDDY